jgi:hypothetical protein
LHAARHKIGHVMHDPTAWLAQFNVTYREKLLPAQAHIAVMVG